MNLIPLSFLFILNRAMSISCSAPRNLPSSTANTPPPKSEQSILSSDSTSLEKSKQEENMIKIETEISASTISKRDLCLLLTF